MMLKYLSYIIGHLVRIKGPLARLALRIFANFYKVDLTAAAKPLCDYACIGDFFIRDLKPGLRPVAPGLVSPVDGTMRDTGPILDGKISHVKGVDYAVRDLLGGAGEISFKHYYNFYLSPKDYHQIHAPAAMRVNRVIYVPGRLWPVNDWTLQNRPRVFAENERVIVFGETSFGRIAVVLVAATNVGQISLAFMDLHVNRVPPWERKPQQIEFPLTSPITLKAGDKLGCFHMGSSVLVLLEKSPENQLPLAPKAVLYGQSI